jgi:hypothetical protein
VPHAVGNGVLADTYGKNSILNSNRSQNGAPCRNPRPQPARGIQNLPDQNIRYCRIYRPPNITRRQSRKPVEPEGPRCVKPNTWFEYVSHASAQRRTTVTTNSSSQCQTAVHKSTKRISLERFPSPRPKKAKAPKGLVEPDGIEPTT